MYLAIDVGGTKTLLALFSANGSMVKKLKFPTDHDPAVFSSDLQTDLLKFFPEPKLRTPTINCVTVAIAATVDHDYTIKEAHLYNRPLVYGNLPWGDFDFSGTIAACIKNLFKEGRIRSPKLTEEVLPYTPIYIQNDANLATYFEARGIHGKTVYLTFSTGIGAGIYDNGELSPVSDGYEPGHKQYIWQGKRTEYEDIASANALHDAYGKIATDITGPQNFEDIAVRMAIGLADVIKDQEPDTLIIGGALGLRLRYYKKYLTKVLSVSLSRSEQDLPNIIAAKFPLESTVYGCYLYGKSKN